MPQERTAESRVLCLQAGTEITRKNEWSNQNAHQQARDTQRHELTHPAIVRGGGKSVVVRYRVLRILRVTVVRVSQAASPRLQ